MSAPLKYLSDRALEQLRRDVPNNLERYRGAGFQDLANDPGWDIPLEIDFDDELLAELDLSKPQRISEVDLENSKLVGNALSSLSPSLANEERVWVRLAHVETFEYTRARWLGSDDDEILNKQVNDHAFAPSQTGIRDDHALSRLWWNHHIAKTCCSDDVDGALELFLKRADIRNNFVERIWMTSRRNIAGAVLNYMRTDPWLTEAESNFREFMKSLNRFGGGIVFEALNDQEASEFTGRCCEFAKSNAL